MKEFGRVTGRRPLTALTDTPNMTIISRSCQIPSNEVVLLTTRIATFDDWVDLLEDWQKEIGLDVDLVKRYVPDYRMEAKYGELPAQEITFGSFAGERRWE